MNHTKNITISYITALCLTALLLIFAYILIHQQISTQEADARIINLSGRQRMLSQQLTKEILLMVQSQDIESKKIYHQELKDIIATLSKVHNGLKNGDKKLKLPGNNSSEVLSYFEKVDPYYQKIKSAVDKLLKLDSNSLDQLSFAAGPVRDVVDSSPVFLEWMDKIVFQYQKESDKKLDILRRYQRNILAVVLSILFLEALLIFRPMIRRVLESYESLLQANKQIREKSDELENANRLLKEMDKTKTDFLDMVAHDLRNPLTAVRSYSDLLLRYWDPSNKVHKEYVEIIKKESIRLSNLINDYLDFSKIEAGKLDFKEEQFDIRELIDYFVKLYQGVGEAKQIMICSEVEKNLPIIKGDRGKLGQVFSNLLGNSIKFTPLEGFIKIKASSMRIQKEGTTKPFVKISISDTGIGISKDLLGKIFDKFGWENHKSNIDGHGLGLFISKAIIEKHGGNMEVESKKGTGTTFSFTLKALDKDTENMERSA